MNEHKTQKKTQKVVMTYVHNSHDQNTKTTLNNARIGGKTPEMNVPPRAELVERFFPIFFKDFDF